MSLGVPIVAPELDFARYVCGDAAVFYDPWDIESIFEKIMLVRENPSLCKEMAEKGRLELLKSEKFSATWEEVATDVLTNLKQLS